MHEQMCQFPSGEVLNSFLLTKVTLSLSTDTSSLLRGHKRTNLWGDAGIKVAPLYSKNTTNKGQ